MRVTENINYETIRGSIRRSRERMEGLQQQSATLRKLNTPSDNPVAASKILEIRTDKVNNDQFQNNAKMAETFLNNSDHAVGELADIVARAKEIALGQSSGASSTTDTRLGIVEEVNQLFQAAVAAANRRIGDRYLFGGYRTQNAPVSPEGNYQGDDGQMMVEIARGVFLAMNLAGHEVFNTNPKVSQDGQKLQKELGVENRTLAQSGAVNLEGGRSQEELAQMDLMLDTSGDNVNVFDELQNLRISLLTGDLDAIRNTLDRFDQLHAKLISTRSKIGSRMQGLQSTAQAIERHNLTNAQLSSSLEDADMAQVVSDLAKEETVLRSALASSQKLIQPTLLDFLK